MKLFKKNKKNEDAYNIDDIIDKSIASKTLDTDDSFDQNGLEHVIDRIEGGLIGSLRISSDMNYPLFKKGDIVHLRGPQRILKKDIVLYKDHDEYYLRRIIKYENDGMYVAGDNENAYHIIKKEDIVAKAIARERGNSYLSLTLQQCNPLYTFIKVRFAFIRLGNRVIEHEQDLNTESLEVAKQVIMEQEGIKELKIDSSNDGLEAELASFKDPNELVYELNEEKKNACPSQTHNDEELSDLTDKESKEDLEMLNTPQDK